MANVKSCPLASVAGLYVELVCSMVGQQIEVTNSAVDHALIHRQVAFLWRARGPFNRSRHSVMCSLIPLLWLGTVPPRSLWHSLPRYAGAHWPATPNAHIYHYCLSPSCTLQRAPALAFSSQDKGSWCLACRDLIAKSHFTFPKPGLIHLSAPADRNMLLSPLFPCLCFSFPPNLEKKEKKGGGG